MSAIFAPNNLADLLIEEDQSTIYNAMLQIATTLNLPVTSWQAGDPTRSTFFIESKLLVALEQLAVGFIGAGFLDYAQDEWLNITAKQVFNVDVPAATFAATTETLTNAGGGIYVIEAGDLIFKNSTTGATYHNTTGGTLTGVGTSGATLTLSVTADVAGSGGSSSVGEIDTLVTTLLGVTCSNPTAAVGIDQQDPATTIQQCRDKQGSLSPNGPAAAYSFVALNAELTGVMTVTRARVYADSDTGDVTIYVAGTNSGISSPDVAAVQAAVQLWATPLCITPTVVSANPVTVNVTYTLWIYQTVGQTTAQIQTAVAAALTSFFEIRPIGGDIIPPATTGALYQGVIESVIGNAFPGQTFRVQVSAPSGDTALGNGDVAVLGSIASTVFIIAGP